MLLLFLLFALEKKNTTMKRFLLSFLLAIFLTASFAQTNTTFYDQLIQHAMDRTKVDITYDQSYRSMKYPGGDVPPDIGVCTDVIVRIYRKMDIDLQKEIHEDMKKALTVYRKRKNTKVIDTNIDHRRVQNMMTYFDRHGTVLPITDKATDYQPGDIVCWDLGFITHIGIVVKTRTYDGGRYQVVHNIGAGPQMEDYLFGSKIIGHYRFDGKK
jgi:uncharacterized protein YijF (DUF1287 family)